MKKIFLITLVCLIPHSGALGAICYLSACSGTETSDNSYFFPIERDEEEPYDPGCIYDLSKECRGGSVLVYSCDACKQGYTRTQVDTTIGTCGGIIFYYCVPNCVNTCIVGGGARACSISNGTGTQHVTGGNSCTLPGTCTYSTCAVAGCDVGYYKKSTTECASCIIDTSSLSATSSILDNTLLGIAACFLPSGTGSSDPSGNWKYNDKCYYGI